MACEIDNHEARIVSNLGQVGLDQCTPIRTPSWGILNFASCMLYLQQGKDNDSMCTVARHDISFLGAAHR